MKRIKSLIVGLLIRKSSSRQAQIYPIEHMLSSQYKLFNSHAPSLHRSATSMLVTDVGDEMCWSQFKDVGDGSSMIVLTISVTNIFNLLKIAFGTNILKMSSRF